MKDYRCNLTRLSKKAKEILPEILDKNGYAGRYRLDTSADRLVINSTSNKVQELFHKAEVEAMGEEGRMIFIKQESFSTLWIPGKKSIKEAYTEALDAVENGWPVDQNPITAVGCVEDSVEENTYREEWQLEYMPD